MKTKIKIIIQNAGMIFLAMLMLQFQQPDSTITLSTLGKGTIYLKENRILIKVTLKEVKPLYITYEKEHNLHDRMMDEIDHIDFPDAKPLPVKMIFENNKPVMKNMSTSMNN